MIFGRDTFQTSTALKRSNRCTFLIIAILFVIANFEHGKIINGLKVSFSGYRRTAPHGYSPLTQLCLIALDGLINPKRQRQCGSPLLYCFIRNSMYKCVHINKQRMVCERKVKKSTSIEKINTKNVNVKVNKLFNWLMEWSFYTAVYDIQISPFLLLLKRLPSLGTHFCLFWRWYILMCQWIRSIRLVHEKYEEDCRGDGKNGSLCCRYFLKLISFNSEIYCILWLYVFIQILSALSSYCWRDLFTNHLQKFVFTTF